MPKRVLLATRDLVFRSKLGEVVAAAGGEATREAGTCDIAVVDLELADVAARIRDFVTRGVPVLAYGSHVRADLLRAAREAGATAVPNSQVEETLRGLVSKT